MTVKAMVAGWQARALAVTGDRVGFEWALSRASTLYDRADISDAPDWAYWFVDPATLFETGRAWTLVGRPERAIAIVEQQVLDEGAEYARDHALADVYLAEAHTAAGNLDVANRYATESRGMLTGGVQSPRCAAVLNALR